MNIITPALMGADATRLRGAIAAARRGPVSGAGSGIGNSKAVLLVVLTTIIISVDIMSRLEVAAQGQSPYSCLLETCLPESSCVCASPESPFLDGTPQMIAVSFSGMVSKALVDRVNVLPSILTKCFASQLSVPLSIYADPTFSDSHAVRDLYTAGHDVGIQVTSISQAATLNSFNAFNLPNSEVMSFRLAPTIEQPAATRAVLFDLGFSSELATLPSSFWPFTLDHGWPYTCDSGFCDIEAKFPGLFEIPAYDAESQTNSASEWFEHLKLTLEERLNGRRQPLVIDMGLAVGNEAYAKAFSKFLLHAADLAEVEFVKIQQIVEFMRTGEMVCIKPLELDQCMQPVLGCGRGVWSERSCSCECNPADPLNENDHGTCTDEEGRCTISMVFDPNTNVIQCPTHLSNEDASNIIVKGYSGLDIIDTSAHSTSMPSGAPAPSPLPSPTPTSGNAPPLPQPFSTADTAEVALNATEPTTRASKLPVLAPESRNKFAFNSTTAVAYPSISLNKGFVANGNGTANITSYTSGTNRSRLFVPKKSSSGSSSKSNNDITGPAVGLIVVGSILAVILTVAALSFIRQRQSNSSGARRNDATDAASSFDFNY